VVGHAPGQPARGYGGDLVSAPSATTLATMTDLWREVFELGDEAVDPDEGFFEAGGTSYQALTLVTRIEETFGVEVDLLTVLTEGSVAFLAEAVDEQHEQELAGLSDEDARRRLAELSEGV
jgi:acyl carrier protein